MGDAPVKAPETDRLVRVSELPPNLQWAVSRLSPEDRHLVETCLCRMPFSRDLVEIVRFIDQVWNQARNAEYRASDKRITGTEMDAFRARMEEAVRALLAVNVELAQRAGLTEIMQRQRRMLSRHGYRIGPKAPAKRDAAPPRAGTGADASKSSDPSVDAA